MTREEFKQILDDKEYSYKTEGNKIIITKECGNVDLENLETLPEEVVFLNEGYVWLENLETLPEGVVFLNYGDVYLNYLRTITKKVVFSNSRDVYLKSLMGGFFNRWNGNIEGITSKRLLNKMIELGLFDRR
jgi:hypothetical protein